jgi:hypothetical protein
VREARRYITAPFLASEGSFSIGAPSIVKDDTPHPAPRHTILVTTQGEYQITTIEGVIRHFPVGSVQIVEDTTGVGHSTKITSAGDLIIFVVGLPAA